jgi:hypothetical protein
MEIIDTTHKHYPEQQTKNTTIIEDKSIVIDDSNYEEIIEEDLWFIRYIFSQNEQNNLIWRKIVSLFILFPKDYKFKFGIINCTNNSKICNGVDHDSMRLFNNGNIEKDYSIFEEDSIKKFIRQNNHEMFTHKKLINSLPKKESGDNNNIEGKFVQLSNSSIEVILF